MDTSSKSGRRKGVGSLFLIGSGRFQTKSMGLAILYFAARGGKLVHLVYLVFLVYLGTEKGSGVFF